MSLKEDQRKAIRPEGIKDGEHDDLGVHPERREAEVDDLENLYNQEARDNEDRNTDPDKATKSEQDSLPNEVDGQNDDSDEDDDPEWNNNVKGKKNKKGFLNKKTGFILGSIGISAILAMSGILSFLSVFRFDHILKNIDVKTFSRYNATMDGLSKNYIRSYIRMRMLEFDNADKAHLGDKDGNLFFRADKVDTGNPIRDWYRTLRTSNFEKKVFNDSGIFFTSSVDASGKIRPGMITIKNDDSPIYLGNDPDLRRKLDAITPALDIASKTGNIGPLDEALNQFGESMDHFVDKEIFESDKSARKNIKKVVNEKTRFYQVLKRRQIRKSIQRMIGVRSWSFFEQTRAKYRQKKQDIFHKILTKVFTGNSETAKLLECIFVGNCSTANDSNNPKLKEATAPIDELQTTEVDDNDDQGNVIKKAEQLGNDELSDSAQEEVEDLANSKINEEGKEIGSESDKLINRIIKKFLGDRAADLIPTAEKVWKYAKILTKFHNMMNDGKLSKIVKRAKLIQLMAIYTSFATARDQARTGELAMDEYGELVKTTDGFGASEGWQAITNSYTNKTAMSFLTPSASAEQIVNVPKEEYCKGDHKKVKGEYAWFCDDQKPNNGGRAETLEDTYKKTIGVIIAPIAGIVNGITKMPILGTAVNFLSDLTSDIIGKVTGPVIDKLMNGTGLGKDITGLMTMLSGKLLSFLGASPLFTGTEPGIANFLLAGSAGTAETATRRLGGVASTELTLAYTNNLAVNYQKEENKNKSTLERYASLNNPTSLASTSLFALSDTNISRVPVGLIDNFANIPKIFATVFTRPVLAAGETYNSGYWADFSGVDKYDIPQQCFDLNPLDPDYLNKATNAWALGIPPSWDTLQNLDEFWKQVYDKVGEENEEAASRIYNCETAYSAVRTGLGATNGYVKDGLDLNAEQNNNVNPGNNTPVGNGKWSVANGANRPGSNLNPLLVSFLNEVAKYTSYEPIVTTGTNHSQYTTSGNVSDHYSGNGADFGSVINKFGTSNAQPGQVVQKGDELAAAGMIACGADPATASANALKGGVYSFKCTINGQNIRVQVLWKTDTGGNHHNHVHIGVKAV